MTIASYIFFFFVLALMFATVMISVFRYKVPQRIVTIDGLRGILALSVFIHHIFLWNQFLNTGSWQLSSNNLVNHCGQSSVSLFFMITAYLFTGKAIRARKASFSWTAYFSGRFFRLFPLYFFSVSMGVIITILLNDSRGVNVWSSLLYDFPKWLAFTIFGMPDTAQSGMSGMVHAYVYWSLHYEWLFYFFLPFLFLLFSMKQVRLWPLIFGSAFILLFAIYHGFVLFHLLSFSGGILAAIIKEFPLKKLNFNSPLLTLLIILLLFFTLYFTPSGAIISLLPLSLIFVCVANGNTVAGLLNLKAMRLVGEISYSIYLLHLPLLFLALRLYSSLYADNVIAYWLIISATTLILLILASFTFKFIEKPFMDIGKKIFK